MNCNNIPNFIQYAFWPNCNNHCEFCIHRGKSHHSLDEMIRDIKVLHEALIKDFDETCNPIDISFIGGEFFDDQLNDPTIKSLFYDITKTCSNYAALGKLRRFMICSSLIFDVNKHITQYIDFLKQINLIDFFMLCTSYDTKYRFKTEKHKNQWINNVHFLNELLVNNVHTEIIITQDFINKVLSNQFNISEFEHAHQTIIDFIEPTFIGSFASKDIAIKNLPDFFPTRQSFIKFVQKTCVIDKSVDIERLLDLKLRSRFVRFVNNLGELVNVADRWQSNCRRYGENGEVIPIYTYVDSNRLMTDDIELLRL